MENKIPKIIHYCWFGKKPLPKLAQKCIKSWQKYCPDYQIIRWDETNFDINSNLYVKQAYEAKKYAFVSDYVRLWVLYNYGGIYVDTDLEMVKNIDKFLIYDFFSGFENSNFVPTAIMGAVPHHPLIKELLDIYQSLSFIKLDGELDLTPNTVRITDYLVKNYNLKRNNTYQELKNGVFLYSHEYFCANDITGLKITNNTYTIHHFQGSWLPLSTKISKNIKIFIAKLIGFNNYYRIKHLKDKFISFLHF